MAAAVPEFRALVGDEAAQELGASVGDRLQAGLALKKCFSRMMTCEKKLFVDQLNMLVKRVSEEGEWAGGASAEAAEERAHGPGPGAAPAGLRWRPEGAG